jgi:hypothetical protein
MKYWFLAFSFLIVSFCYPQYSDNAAQTFLQAKQLNKPVLLIFSGSDWCRPCIQFEKKILEDTIFISFCNTKILVLNADFPQRKKQPKSLVTQNELLAKKYNPEGLFPFMVLLNSDEKIIHVVNYNNEDVASFIKLLIGYF